MTAPMAAGTLADFGHDTWWVVLIKVVLVFGVCVVLTLFNIWWERRVVARMQHRIGPNVNGPFGLLQSLADGVKLALKEDLTPTNADKVVFITAPILAVVPSFVTALVATAPTTAITAGAPFSVALSGIDSYLNAVTDLASQVDVSVTGGNPCAVVSTGPGAATATCRASSTNLHSVTVTSKAYPTNVHTTAAISVVAGPLAVMQIAGDAQATSATNPQGPPLPVNSLLLGAGRA